jgi:hypothetical protein
MDSFVGFVGFVLIVFRAVGPSALSYSRHARKADLKVCSTQARGVMRLF